MRRNSVVTPYVRVAAFHRLKGMCSCCVEFETFAKDVSPDDFSEHDRKRFTDSVLAYFAAADAKLIYHLFPSKWFYEGVQVSGDGSESQSGEAVLYIADSS